MVPYYGHYGLNRSGRYLNQPPQAFAITEPSGRNMKEFKLTEVLLSLQSPYHPLINK
jgi:hypothetical protein